MSQLANLALIRARPGQTQALGAALAALVCPTRAEAECLSCELHQSLDDSHIWFVYENWRSAKGLEAHMRAPHRQAFLKVTPALVAGDIDPRRFSMISPLAMPGA